ncbi:glycerate kinase [soil metagenome]
MRILLAPDDFAGTLTAEEAAAAIAAGWRRTAPDDQLDLAPLSDGGTGFLGVLLTAVGGRLQPVQVTGPLGEQVAAELLVVGDTAYVESARAAGRHLVPPGAQDPARATSYGVGQLIAAAVDSGARRVVVGVGGTATNDGGAGALVALGARLDPAPDGVPALSRLERADLAPARRRLAGVELIAATDVDHVLVGEQGASAIFGPQKGASPELVAQLDAALRRWAEVAGRSAADAPGAGAGGGLGYALMLLGGARVSGAAMVLDLLDVGARAAEADLVVTGEGSFDWQSLRGKVISEVARAAREAGRPCVVLAGRVEVGRREMAALGVEAAYALSPDRAGDPVEGAAAERLAALAAHVAHSWSH